MALRESGCGGWWLGGRDSREDAAASSRVKHPAPRGLAHAADFLHHWETARPLPVHHALRARSPLRPAHLTCQVMNDIDVLLTENRKFAPDASFRRAASVSSREMYDYAAGDPVGYWEAMARELSWSKPWTKALEWTPPHVKWFVGGQLNAAYNC